MVQNKAERTCGECSLCCFTHGVSTSVRKLKEAGEWCQHCDRGAGCKVYDGRPFACFDFTCRWRAGEGEDWHRPDLTDVVEEWMPFRELGRVLRMAAGESPDALDSAYAISVAQKYAAVYCPVLLCHRHKPWELCLDENFPISGAARFKIALRGISIITPQDLEQRI